MGNTPLRGYWPDISAVHPHAYGEHNISLNSFDCICGSSPRIWGTLFNLSITYRKYTSAALEYFANKFIFNVPIILSILFFYGLIVLCLVLFQLVKMTLILLHPSPWEYIDSPPTYKNRNLFHSGQSIS